MAIYEQGSGLSPDIESDGALILDFQPPELWEIHLLFISHPVCGIVIVPWTDHDNVNQYLHSACSVNGDLKWYNFAQLFILPSHLQICKYSWCFAHNKLLTCSCLLYSVINPLLCMSQILFLRTYTDEGLTVRIQNIFRAEELLRESLGKIKVTCTWQAYLVI